MKRKPLKVWLLIGQNTIAIVLYSGVSLWETWKYIFTPLWPIIPHFAAVMVIIPWDTLDPARHQNNQLPSPCGYKWCRLLLNSQKNWKWRKTKTRSIRDLGEPLSRSRGADWFRVRIHKTREALEKYFVSIWDRGHLGILKKILLFFIGTFQLWNGVKHENEMRDWWENWKWCYAGCLLYTSDAADE